MRDDHGQIIDREAVRLQSLVEHNLDVVKTADWIIDLGPEGGPAGGEIIAQGTPEQVATVRSSHTGRHLRALLGRPKTRTAKRQT